MKEKKERWLPALASGEAIGFGSAMGAQMAAEAASVFHFPYCAGAESAL